ncbi:hypothetical protein CONLIGDRAFT_409144 [Coniochaeta ligniaria NRRL 30616]|uniref:Uncharacterized protein n=1 Tax=Coniochaeta ligniaria NRRL 30616 TaxID=1408157 RepID=A0A1J7J7B7_9PEZI|nr:hypothetical protein CONLIGDRAFT_409144 [Coniochaeta ligniaria NRRL 30616]
MDMACSSRHTRPSPRRPLWAVSSTLSQENTSRRRLHAPGPWRKRRLARCGGVSSGWNSISPFPFSSSDTSNRPQTHPPRPNGNTPPIHNATPSPRRPPPTRHTQRPLLPNTTPPTPAPIGTHPHHSRQPAPLSPISSSPPPRPPLGSALDRPRRNRRRPPPGHHPGPQHPPPRAIRPRHRRPRHPSRRRQPDRQVGALLRLLLHVPRGPLHAVHALPPRRRSAAARVVPPPTAKHPTPPPPPPPKIIRPLPTLPPTRRGAPRQGPGSPKLLGPLRQRPRRGVQQGRRVRPGAAGGHGRRAGDPDVRCQSGGLFEAGRCRARQRGGAVWGYLEEYGVVCCEVGDGR